MRHPAMRNHQRLPSRRIRTQLPPESRKHTVIFSWRYLLLTLQQVSCAEEIIIAHEAAGRLRFSARLSRPGRALSRRRRREWHRHSAAVDLGDYASAFARGCLLSRPTPSSKSRAGCAALGHGKRTADADAQAETRSDCRALANAGGRVVHGTLRDTEYADERPRPAEFLLFDAPPPFTHGPRRGALETTRRCRQCLRPDRCRGATPAFP